MKKKVLIFILFLPIIVKAEYIIYLKNGEESRVDDYKIKNGEICFQMYGGEMCFSQDDVLKIAEASPENKEPQENKPQEFFSKKPDSDNNIFIPTEFQEGLQYYQKAEYEKTIVYFTDKLGEKDDVSIRKIIANSYSELAHQFYNTNKIDDSIKMLQKAIEYNPNQSVFYKNIGILYYNEGKYEKAIKMFEKTIELDPNDSFGHEYSGRCYYFINNSQQALEKLDIAINLNPNNSPLMNFKKQVESEYKNERFFGKTSKEIFIIRYDRESEFRLSTFVLDVLAEAYWHILQNLSYYEKKDFKIPVIIYTQKDFSETVKHPDWAGAIYDGKIKIPVGNIDEQSDKKLENFIYHEVTHSVLFYYIKGNKIPAWLNEGIAQKNEKHSRDIMQIKKWLRDKKLIPLKDLEESFIKYTDQNIVDLAYMESLLAVDFIETQYSSSAILNILRKLKENKTIEEAISSVLFTNSSQFENNLFNYIVNN